MLRGAARFFAGNTISASAIIGDFVINSRCGRNVFFRLPDLLYLNIGLSLSLCCLCVSRQLRARVRLNSAANRLARLKRKYPRLFPHWLFRFAKELLQTSDRI